MAHLLHVNIVPLYDYVVTYLIKSTVYNCVFGNMSLNTMCAYALTRIRLYIAMYLLLLRLMFCIYKLYTCQYLQITQYTMLTEHKYTWQNVYYE